MYQIDDPTCVQVDPGLPTDAVVTPGFFSGGNPAVANSFATRVRYWWLNMVQTELVTIVAAAGIKLAKGTNTQVLAALQVLFMPRGAVMGNSKNTTLTPIAGQVITNTLTFTPTVPGLLFVIGSVNLGAPGQQPGGCTNELRVNGVHLAGDQTTGSMTNFGTVAVPAGALVTVTQTYTATATAGQFCSTSCSLTFQFTPT